MARKSKIDGEDEVEIHDEDESEEIQTGKEVSTGVSLIRMWPRAIFTTSEPPGQGQRGKPPTIAFNIKLLDSPGVYVLYRDDQPYYVGQTKGKLRSRLRRHAAGVGIRSYFWNYFSAFVVKDNVDKIDEIEAVLISAMPSVLSNGAAPRLHRFPMGKPTRDLLRKMRNAGKS